jgi:alpha-L-fucosidase 2
MQMSHPLRFLAIVLISAGGWTVQAQDEPPRSRVIWTNQPVAAGAPRGRVRWGANAYPIGNGRLGCTTFGDPQKEIFQINEDSLWIGHEGNTGAYQPFCNVYVEFDHDPVTDYRRELDISRAVNTITYTHDGVRYKRQYFASYPAQVLVLHFSADKPGALEGAVSMSNHHNARMTAQGRALTILGDTSNERLGRRRYMSGENIKLDFEGRVYLMHDGGKTKVVEDKIVFESCNSVTLLVAADTNYLNQREKGWTGPHPHQRVTRQIEAAAKRSFDELLDEHVKDYQQIYGRLAIDLGPAAEGTTDLPTPQRLAAYKQQREPGLEAMLYQYARYLMISSSRPAEGLGVMPANLQGLWNPHTAPPWRSDYHTDINLQMNYWFVQQANLTECFMPVARWIDSIREVRKEETHKAFGVDRGWLMRSENGIFGGSTWHFQKGDSAWLCNNLWDHYRFTRDTQYLREFAYPVMKEISHFWIDHLKELPDGKLVAPGGRSPEHGPKQADGVSYDQQLCWDLFNNTIEATKVLGVDADLRKQLTDKRDRLVGPKIGKWGQLQEWMEDIDDPKNQHRHVSHMIAVFPGHQIHPTTTPDLAAAAIVSLVARGNGHTGWSKVWRSLCYARLLVADKAYNRINDLIASKTYGNLWMTHPPFQIDANFGYAAAVNEMLLQSHTDKIHLLPALPDAWPTGSVRGMRARGGFELDMKWQDGKLVQVEVRNITNPDGRCDLFYNNTKITRTIRPGRPLTLTADAFTK